MLDPSDPVAYKNAIYPYCPSFGAALLFAVLFAIVLIAHFAQAITYRKSFCWVVCMAAIWEGIGWGVRAVSTMHNDRTVSLDVNLNIISTIFTLIAPIWLNAFVYMTFGRMVLYFLPDKKVWRISARWLTFIFVMLDITAFIIQLIGALILTGRNSSLDTKQTGFDIYMIGVGIQELFILCFGGLSFLFWKQAQKWPVYRDQTANRMLYVLWTVLVLISIRIIFRIAEYSEGTGGYATTHEWLIYVWDALPMFLAMLLFLFIGSFSRKHCIKLA